MATKSFSTDKIQPVAAAFLTRLTEEAQIAAAFAADSSKPAPKNSGDRAGQLTTEQLIEATKATDNVLLARAAAASLVTDDKAYKIGRTRSTAWAYKSPEAKAAESDDGSVSSAA